MLNASRFVFIAIIMAFVVGLLPGCVAQEDIILPTKYERVAQSNAYKNCVASATNSRIDETTQPEIIVRNSLAACSHFKHKMLTAYPDKWRENYMKKVDTQLFKRETNWIVETRTKKNTFFR